MFRGQISRHFEGSLRGSLVEAYHKLPRNFRRHQTGNFLKTSSDPAAVSRKFPRNFLAGVLTLGLLILTLAANFAHSGKPNFYFEVKIFTLRIDFEGKAKTGEVKIFNFGFEVNFLTCLVYWAAGPHPDASVSEVTTACRSKTQVRELKFALVSAAEGI